MSLELYHKIFIQNSSIISILYKYAFGGGLELATLISTCKSNLASSLSDRSHTLTDLSKAEVTIISLAKG